jgi:CO/xanthine dehydrogenase Mo-binding subunit
VLRTRRVCGAVVASPTVASRNAGGTEIGQGLFTKVAQSVAYKLGIDISLINVVPTSTSATPAITYTGGSSTSECSVISAMAACDVLLTRLANLKKAMPTVCSSPHAHPLSFRSLLPRVVLVLLGGLDVFAGWPHRSRVLCAACVAVCFALNQATWPELTFAASNLSIDLCAEAAFQPSGGLQDIAYYVWSAACSTVEIDVLTGEVEFLTTGACPCLCMCLRCSRCRGGGGSRSRSRSHRCSRACPCALLHCNRHRVRLRPVPEPCRGHRPGEASRLSCPSTLRSS